MRIPTSIFLVQRGYFPSSPAGEGGLLLPPFVVVAAAVVDDGVVRRRCVVCCRRSCCESTSDLVRMFGIDESQASSSRTEIKIKSAQFNYMNKLKQIGIVYLLIFFSSTLPQIQRATSSRGDF